jgi:hypothetical protein
MISMRYAQNFIHGTGLVWSDGNTIEGYSNFLMVLIMSLAQLIFGQVSAVLVVQLFGAGIMLGIAWNVYQILDFKLCSDLPGVGLFNPNGCVDLRTIFDFMCLTIIP